MGCCQRRAESSGHPTPHPRAWGGTTPKSHLASRAAEHHNTKRSERSCAIQRSAFNTGQLLTPIGDTKKRFQHGLISSASIVSTSATVATRCSTLPLDPHQRKSPWALPCKRLADGGLIRRRTPRPPFLKRSCLGAGSVSGCRCAPTCAGLPRCSSRRPRDTARSCSARTRHGGYIARMHGRPRRRRCGTRPYACGSRDLRRRPAVDRPAV